MRDDRPPKGGWLPPPGNTERLPPLATARGTNKKGKWRWDEHDLTPKQEKKHRRFQKAMKEADREGRTNFEW